MEIKINGQTADITVDSEKTVGEVISGLDQWISNTGHRLSGIAIDGQSADSASVEEFFSREIDKVKTLDLYTCSIADLCVQSFLSICGDIDEFENMDFAKRQAFCENWSNSPQARFAAEQMPDFFSLCVQVFSGSGTNCETLRAMTEERLREVESPAAELTGIGTIVNETCAMLADLPLDIQTGKDARAAQTIQIFSGIAVKILRIVKILNLQGLVPEAIKESINEFSESAKELLEAYERHDTVIVGDIAEYEMAPKLQKLYTAIEENNKLLMEQHGIK